MNVEKMKACIFDFDGVIVDSEKIHAKAKEATLDRFEVPYPAMIFEMFKGQTDKDFFTYVFQHLAKYQAGVEEMLACKKDIYRTLFEEIQLIEGFDDFIKYARERFESLGITTSTTLHDYTLARQKFQVEGYFDFIITGEDTLKHKPDPEPYLLAAKKLNVDISQAMVIEDSPNGIKSAKTAGFAVFGITTSFSEEVLIKAGADYVVQSYAELKVFLEKKKASSH